MQEKSLRINRADSSFFGKISFTLNKIFIPTKIGINSMLISIKRSALLKAYINYVSNDNTANKDDLEKRYEKAYEQYLDTLDKYVMDTIYTKVKSNRATQFEKDSVVKYSLIIAQKDKDYDEYKYNKQKYLLDLDFESIKQLPKTNDIFIKFYLDKVDSLYKSLLKTFAIKIANKQEISYEDILFEKVFDCLHNYISNYLCIKIEYEPKYLDKIPEYSQYEKYLVGKFNTKDTLEQNILQLAISRRIFTHSLPLAVVEKCYKNILYRIRILLKDTKIIVKRENAYNVLLNLQEEYKIKLLKNKVYWDSIEQKKAYKKFSDKYNKIMKLKDSDLIEYIKQKEIILLYDELHDLYEEKVIDFSQLIQYYRRKLIDYGQIRELKNSYLKLFNSKYLVSKSKMQNIGISK